ncbi:MAG: S41 family peptidase, partial [Pseudonocardiaceae bacterium]
MTDSYLRFPHLHGDLLTFVAEDDVWVAPLAGGRAWRLSADRVPAVAPRFSPDGAEVAWTSWRDGAPEVHVAPVDGGAARRLTHWGNGRTRVRGWMSDAEILVVTAAGTSSSRRTWAHAVPVDGGPARRLPYGPVDSVAIGANGILLGSVVSREPAWWKRYRGGTTGKVWLRDAGEAGFRRILDELDGHVVDPLWVAGRIVVASDHEGVGNVYSVAPDRSDLRRHSDHGAGDHGAGDHDRFYARHLGTDGERVVYERAGELWLIDELVADSAPRRIEVALGGPRTARAPRPVPVREFLGKLSVDHTARASAIEVRGTVQWLTHRDGPVTALAAAPGIRGRLPVMLPGDRAAWVTDAEGDDALEIDGRDGAADGTSRRLAAGLLGRVLELAAAPDGRQLAAATHDGRLLLVDTGSGEVREVARSEHGECHGPVFSPDSAWLAWSHPGPDPVCHIRLARLADLDVLDVTEPRFVDFAPAFTRDGKHLAFLSLRSFDPVYDAHVFDLSFPAGCRPHLVPLAALTPSPFDPEPAGREPRPSKDDKGDEEESPPVTTVDPEGLAGRVVPVPVPEARYGSLHAAQDGLLWLRYPVSGALGDGRVGTDDRPRPVLERYDLVRRRCEVLVDGLTRVAVSGDGKRIVVRDGETLRVLPADRRIEDSDSDSDSDDVVRVDLDRLRVTVDPAAEWRQMFDEAGRLMRDHFWSPDLAGVDWDGVLADYRPLVERVGSHDDLVDLLWEVNGELGTSHAYVLPDAEPAEAARLQGLLGADLERDGAGSWRVARVLPGESSDPWARSPLSAPGVAVRAGDAVLAVAGRPVDPVTGPAPLLAGTAGHPVELLIGPAGGGAPRRVVVVPLADEERLRYQDWVADRRAYVLQSSGGRVGYLHVPDMMGHGWAQLHRDLRVEALREALVVDVRENRGGHVSQLVVEKLARKVLGWDIGRHRSPWTYPLDAPRGPVVAVANEFSGSDGDMVTAAIKALGVGPVVGTRTWGGVIGIDMRYTLVDGTLVTQPRYATWFNGYGWELENHGVDPDVEVVMTPDDWVAGRDPQLDTAVRLALQALERQPAATPPDVGTRPSRARP